MSFRVWFLRMVWIVAAAVALSGCPDDEKKDDETPAEGGPTLAVAVTPAEVTMGAEDASGDHDVKVTITSDDDAHKTAEVELSVACTGTDVEVEIETAKKDAAAGMAEWKGQSVELDAATVCTYTAKALEKEATGTFTVKAAAAAADTAAITFATGYPAEDAGTGGQVNVHLAYANVSDISTVEIYVACGTTVPMAAVTKVGANKVTCTDEASTTDVYECTVAKTDDQKCNIVVAHGDLSNDLVHLELDLSTQ